MSNETTTYTRRHMSMNIAGFLRHHAKKNSWAGYFNNEDGIEMTDREAREFIQQCLAKGWKKIPLGHCDGFDYFGGGCPGHTITKEEYEKDQTT